MNLKYYKYNISDADNNDVRIIIGVLANTRTQAKKMVKKALSNKGVRGRFDLTDLAMQLITVIEPTYILVNLDNGDEVERENGTFTYNEFVEYTKNGDLYPYSEDGAYFNKTSLKKPDWVDVSVY
jgi:hypothetical protein